MNGIAIFLLILVLFPLAIVVYVMAWHGYRHKRSWRDLATLFDLQRSKEGSFFEDKKHKLSGRVEGVGFELFCVYPYQIGRGFKPPFGEATVTLDQPIAGTIILKKKLPAIVQRQMPDLMRSGTDSERFDKQVDMWVNASQDADLLDETSLELVLDILAHYSGGIEIQNSTISYQTVGKDFVNTYETERLIRGLVALAHRVGRTGIDVSTAPVSIAKRPVPAGSVIFAVSVGLLAALLLFAAVWIVVTARREKAMALFPFLLAAGLITVVVRVIIRMKKA